MIYGTYNDELGYANAPEFKNAFDAVIAASGKCRRHSVLEYNDNGEFVRRLTDEEERAIYERGAQEAPAMKVAYIFPARTPLATDENEKANYRYIQPFKDLAESRGIQFGGLGSLVGVSYSMGKDVSIKISVDYRMPAEDRARFDAVAKDMRCPLVIEENEYLKEKSVKSYK